MAAQASSSPVFEPGRLLTIGEYAALGEDHRRLELLEGNLVMSPSPTPLHNSVLAELIYLLRPQVPSSMRLIPDVDVDLQLAPAGQPGFARRPDLVVVDDDAYRRARDAGSLLRAAAVRLAVEIVSPGSRRTDHVIKRGEYADAGIPYYWVIDTDDPISLLCHHLAGDFGYADDGAVTGTFTAVAPFPCTIDLNRLV
jgi:Uma2 family endonuclease